MIRFKKKPDFKQTGRRLEKFATLDVRPLLEEFGRRGADALSAATPVDTGETSMAWSYKIKGNRELYKLVWTNSVVAGTAPLVLMIQYGHATKSGYFFTGVDFINPALRPVYASLSKRLREEIFR